PALFRQPAKAPPAPGGVPQPPPGAVPPPAVQGAEAEPTASTSYLTVHPGLKVVLDRLERDKKPTLMFIAALTEKAKGLPRQATADGILDAGEIESFLKPRKRDADELLAVAFALNEIKEIRAAGMVVLETGSEESTRKVKQTVDVLLQLLPELFREKWN